MIPYDFTKPYIFRTFQIPERMMSSIDRYVNYHEYPGNFLTAIIQNDLKAAVAHADYLNLINIPAYVGFFYNEAPNLCWGSITLFNNWIGKKN